MNVNILIVDDQPANILALEKLLAQDDVSFLKAKSGQVALNLILENEIALALIDIHMPQMSGIELAQLMRGSQLSRAIPIIFVTAHSPDEKMIFAGYEKGAVDFLQKPLVKPIVRSKVQTFIDLHRTQKRLQEQVENSARMKTLADDANYAKSRFLANMSHDIRTPLNAILGYAELMQHEEQWSKEKYDEFASLIVRNGRLLATLLDDVLDLSKIEANCLKVVKEVIDVKTTLSTVRSTFVPQMRAKDLELRLTTSPSLPATISSDPIRLQQILNNLVGNAVKFTDQGFVELRVDYSKGKLSFEVEDSGQGIAAAEQDKIFQPFEQAANGHRGDGTGLGLTISFELARALGGELRLVRSEIGVGSLFRFEVSGEPSSGAYSEERPLPTTRAKKAATPNFTDLRILVVDDAWENRDIVQHFLTRAGATVNLAADGLECLHLVDNSQFDMIFMDLEMPRLGGIATMRELRERHVDIPVVALTAHAMQDDRNGCLEAGFTRYMTKPIKLPELYGLIAELR